MGIGFIGGMFLVTGLMSLTAAVVVWSRTWRLNEIMRRWESLPLSARWSIGQVIGGVVGSAVILIGSALGTMMMGVLLGITAYVLAGLSLPRLPETNAKRRASQIRRQLPAFVGFLRITLGQEPFPIACNRYLAVSHSRNRLMRDVVRRAIDRSQRMGIPLPSAFYDVAHQEECPELQYLADILKRSFEEGLDVRSLMEQQQQLLQSLLRNEFRRAIQQRGILLLLVTAISVIVGVLGNLLYVIIAGSDIARFVW